MKYAILGAGPSGLATALFLKYPNIVLEKNSHPGGHTSSFYHKGYTFDQGPHIMFSKNKEILDFMVRSLGKNIYKSRRNNKISFKNRLLKWPFENNLYKLPLEDNYLCLKSYLFNPYKKRYPNPKNLKEWLLHHFGKGICELYLFPYNEKVWNISVENLSMIWAGRIPYPDKDDILKSALGINTEGYLHQLYYYYPLRGGYQAICESWAKKVKVKYNYEIKKIEINNRGGFRLTNGSSEVKTDRIISTIPIHELVKIINFPLPKYVRKAVQNLIVNPMVVISLGIKGEDSNKYTAIYFPESDFLVNRISFPKTFSPFNAPSGYYSIQAEITFSKNSAYLNKSNSFFINHTLIGLLKRGVIKDTKSIVLKNIQRIPYAYVVYDKDYEMNVKIIREWFPKKGIDLVGRFSYLEYINVDGAIERAISLANKLNEKQTKLSNYFVLND